MQTLHVQYQCNCTAMYCATQLTQCRALTAGLEDIPSTTATAAYLCHSIRLFGGKYLMGGGENIFLHSSNIFQPPSTNIVLTISFPIFWPIQCFTFFVQRCLGFFAPESYNQLFEMTSFKENCNHQHRLCVFTAILTLRMNRACGQKIF